jgi:hypothetical protein
MDVNKLSVLLDINIVILIVVVLLIGSIPALLGG